MTAVKQAAWLRNCPRSGKQGSPSLFRPCLHLTSCRSPLSPPPSPPSPPPPVRDAEPKMHFVEASPPMGNSTRTLTNDSADRIDWFRTKRDAHL